MDSTEILVTAIGLLAPTGIVGSMIVAWGRLTQRIEHLESALAKREAKGTEHDRRLAKCEREIYAYLRGIPTRQNLAPTPVQPLPFDPTESLGP